MRTGAIGLAFGLLAGCSTMPAYQSSDQVTYNPANYHGCTVVPYYIDEAKRTAFIACQDKAQVRVSVDLNSDGNVDMVYEADDVVGSDAAAIRAEVEKVFAERGAEIAPGIVDAVVEALTGL